MGFIKNNKLKTASLSGHRTFKTKSFYQSDDSNEIFENHCLDKLRSIIENGYNTWLCGACEGFDIKTGEILIDLKKTYDLSVVCVIPFLKQAEKWDCETKKRHEALLNSSDEIILLSDAYYKGCYHVRNRYLVENSSLLFCYYEGSSGGTKFTYDYASKKGLKIVNVFESFEMQNR